MADDLRRDGPAVVALGGGHGLATALRAMRRYAGAITAVVSVADDGGSSGRLRRDLGVPPPGDLRRCLVALAGDDGVWSDGVRAPLPRRRARGPRARQPRARRAHRDARRLHRTRSTRPVASSAPSGRVLPATVEPVVLKAELDVDGRRDGRGPGRGGRTARGIRRVELVPADAAATPDAVDAIAAADQVVSPPARSTRACSPVLCVAELRAARRRDAGRRWCRSANLRPQAAGDPGLDAADHLPAVLAHGARVDRVPVRRRRRPAARRRTRSRGARGRAGRGAESPGPTGWRTIRTDWRRRSRLCCSPTPSHVNRSRRGGIQ